MYGLFYGRKNNEVVVLFLFQSKTERKAMTKEIIITDWNSIKQFNENIKSLIQSKSKELLGPSYRIYYRNISDNRELKNVMKELNISNENLNNPLVKITNMDIEINNITNVKFKKYDKY